MLNLKPIITRINKLLTENADASVTYAALEARLALEKVCYDRLRQRHDYISHTELLKWQPGAIINKLIQDVDPHVAQTVVFSIGKTEAQAGVALEDHDYVEVGTEIGFDPKRISKLWNALAKLALHVSLPEQRDDYIPEYGDIDEIRGKVKEVVEELERLSQGTMSFSGMGEEVSFDCSCGVKNKRRAELLRDGQHIICFNYDCKYTWKVVKQGDSFEFEAVETSVFCVKCKADNSFPLRVFLDMKNGELGSFSCHTCKHKNYVTWKLMQADLPKCIT
jgi:uncharacterized Zn-finger protein